MPQSLDRESPAEAGAIMESLFPSKQERFVVLARLLKSAEIAEAVAPNAWAVSLFPDYFRLNVGQAEVYVAYAGGFFLNCSASTDIAPFNTGGFTTIRYKSVPVPQCNFRGVPADLKALPSEVEEAHAKFIDLAARAPSGKPRAGTPLKKSHSEGLLKYARQVIRATERGSS
jgi:hypothetical protein